MCLLCWIEKGLSRFFSFLFYVRDQVLSFELAGLLVFSSASGIWMSGVAPFIFPGASLVVLNQNRL